MGRATKNGERMRQIVATRVAVADIRMGGPNPLQGRPLAGRRPGWTSAPWVASPSGVVGRSRPAGVNSPICRGLLTLLLGAATPWAAVATAGTYYVDGSSPTCSPTGPGTEAQPYCTISQAINLRAQ